MRLTKVRMIVDIDFEANGVSPEELKANCEQVIRHGLGEGYFTGDSDAVIETYGITFEDRKRMLR